VGGPSESCAPGWDGYDASSASYDSHLRAKRFIEALPANFPPEKWRLIPQESS
jgi:hypothetical protein